MKNHFSKLLLGVIFLFFSQIIFAQSFNSLGSLYFLGDSLSDVGNNPEHQHMPYSDDKNWVQFLVSKFGMSITYSDRGGNDATDYAYGGAQTDASSPGKAEANRGVQNQVTALLKAHPRLDPQDLCVLWAGANDVLNGILQQGKSSIDIANQGAINIRQALIDLHNAGARYLVLGNLPDLSETPLGQSLPDDKQQEIAGAAALFNAKVLSAVKGIGFPVIVADYYSLFDEINRDPQKYGFTHSYKEQCLHANDVSCKGYIFWDSLHPTAAAYSIIADRTYDMIVPIN